MEAIVERAACIVAESQRIVALTGAGVSTPSGIPDFRSPGSGAWRNVDPTVVASLRAFKRDPQPFYRWIGPLLESLIQAQPNPAHLALAALEQSGKLRAVVTQNIDGLHQAAGSRTVYELHGHVRSATCIRCGQQTDSAAHLPVAVMGHVPRCTCGGAIKPDVVLFDEELPRAEWDGAVTAIQRCDLLLVAGTGLEVFPANSLVDIALRRRAALIIVNYDATWADEDAGVVIRDDVARALPEIVAKATALSASEQQPSADGP